MLTSISCNKKKHLVLASLVNIDVYVDYIGCWRDGTK